MPAVKAPVKKLIQYERNDHRQTDLIISFINYILFK